MCVTTFNFTFNTWTKVIFQLQLTNLCWVSKVLCFGEACPYLNNENGRHCMEKLVVKQMNEDVIMQLEWKIVQDCVRGWIWVGLEKWAGFYQGEEKEERSRRGVQTRGAKLLVSGSLVCWWNSVCFWRKDRSYFRRKSNYSIAIVVRDNV